MSFPDSGPHLMARFTFVGADKRDGREVELGRRPNWDAQPELLAARHPWLSSAPSVARDIVAELPGVSLRFTPG